MLLPYLCSTNLSSQMGLFPRQFGSLLRLPRIEPFFVFLLKLPVEVSTHANWANANFILVSYGDACSWSAFVPGKICSFCHFKMSTGITFYEILSFRKILCQTPFWVLLSHGNRGCAICLPHRDIEGSWWFSVTFCSLDTCFLESTSTRSIPVFYVEHFFPFWEIQIEKTN